MTSFQYVLSRMMSLLLCISMCDVSELDHNYFKHLDLENIDAENLMYLDTVDDATAKQKAPQFCKHSSVPCCQDLGGSSVCVVRLPRARSSATGPPSSADRHHRMHASLWRATSFEHWQPQLSATSAVGALGEMSTFVVKGPTGGATQQAVATYPSLSSPGVCGGDAQVVQLLRAPRSDRGPQWARVFGSSACPLKISLAHGAPLHHARAHAAATLPEPMPKPTPEPTLEPTTPGPTLSPTPSRRLKQWCRPSTPSSSAGPEHGAWCVLPCASRAIRPRRLCVVVGLRAAEPVFFLFSYSLCEYCNSHHNSLLLNLVGGSRLRPAGAPTPVHHPPHGSPSATARPAHSGVPNATGGPP